MKKNMLSIIILALVFMNVILSSLIVFVVIPTSKKTSNLINQVASIIDLELESPKDEKEKKQISVADLITHKIEEKVTINLKNDVGSSTLHYAVLDVALSINTKDPDYKKLSETLAANEGFFTETVREVFSVYTIDEVQGQEVQLKKEILKRIQDFYQSEFIVNVTFGSLVYQ